MNYQIIQNFYEASYLLSKGYELTKIDTSEDKKLIYLFETDNKDISADIANFNNDPVLQSYVSGIVNLRKFIKKYHKNQKNNKKPNKKVDCETTNISQ